ncbi:hypothetical protein LTR08_009135 [Meristemomyces frigidus]|nr:hypothetical protein LTR08_009135 [Meristemomyces frigidus]
MAVMVGVLRKPLLAKLAGRSRQTSKQIRSDGSLTGRSRKAYALSTPLTLLKPMGALGTVGREVHLTPTIEQWVAKVKEEMYNKTDATTIKIDKELYKTPDAVPTEELPAIAKEIVPPYWIPIVFRCNSETGLSVAPQTFWNDHVASKKPRPMHDDDLQDVKPWWQMLEAPGSLFLKPYTAPSLKGIDPDESTNERLARENDHGANNHVQNVRRTELAKQELTRERRKKAEEKAQKYSATVPSSALDRLEPGVKKLYVRRARLIDMVRIRDIYNHYVECTCYTAETERLSTDEMTERYKDVVVTKKLPYLVACERGGRVANRRKSKRYYPEEDLVLPDKVVGYAFADDYNDRTGMYRFTAEVEVYVDKQYYMKNVAKCLLDKLMPLLDPDYIERGGFEVEGDDLSDGPVRVIQNIIINVPYDKPERLEWMSRWLTKGLDFEQKGQLEGIGNKHGKDVSLAIFKRKTGAVINAASPPITRVNAW